MRRFEPGGDEASNALKARTGFGWVMTEETSISGCESAEVGWGVACFTTAVSGASAAVLQQSAGVPCGPQRFCPALQHIICAWREAVAPTTHVASPDVMSPTVRSKAIAALRKRIAPSWTPLTKVVNLRKTLSILFRRKLASKRVNTAYACPYSRNFDTLGAYVPVRARDAHRANGCPISGDAYSSDSVLNR